MEILVVVFITWVLIYNLFYSPRAQIRRLSRQMFNIPIKLARAKKKLGDDDNYFYNTCKKALEVRYKIIIALLDFYFDPQEEGEYIEERKNYAKALLDNVESVMKLNEI